MRISLHIHCLISLRWAHIFKGKIHFPLLWLSALVITQIIRTDGLGGSVGCASEWRPGGHGFDPRRGRQQSFVEIDHEIFSTVLLSLSLIQ